jgi:hypothetical protein
MLALDLENVAQGRLCAHGFVGWVRREWEPMMRERMK